MSQRTLITIGALLGISLSALEVTVVGTAAPVITRDLGGFDSFALLFSLYLFTNFIGMPVWGRASDHWGRRPIFLICMLIFLLGSLFCGLSQTFDQLLWSRALQGLGGGGLVPIAFTIMADIYDIKSRTKIQGYLSAVWGVSSLIGPFIGGIFAETIGWRWIFYINFIPGIIGIYFIVYYFKEKRELVPFSLLIPTKIFKYKIFNMTCFTGFFASAVLMGLASFIPLRNYSATESGLILLPFTLAWVVVSIFSTRLLLTTHYKTLLFFGFSITMMGLLVFNLYFFKMNLFISIVSMFLMGMGMAFNYPIVLISTQYNVPKDIVGFATSTVFWIRTLGGTIGTFAMGSMLSLNIKNNLRFFPSSSDPIIKELSQNTDSLLKPEHLAIIKTNPEIHSILHNSLWPLFLLIFIAACINLIALSLFPQKIKIH